jgi:hypothetical protein
MSSEERAKINELRLSILKLCDGHDTGIVEYVAAALLVEATRQTGECLDVAVQRLQFAWTATEKLN